MVDYGYLTNKERYATIKYKRSEEIKFLLEEHLDFYLEFDYDSISKFLVEHLKLQSFSPAKANLHKRMYKINPKTTCQESRNYSLLESKIIKTKSINCKLIRLSNDMFLKLFMEF